MSFRKRRSRPTAARSTEPRRRGLTALSRATLVAGLFLTLVPGAEPGAAQTGSSVSAAPAVEGPIRWLMTSRELRRARDLDGPGEVVSFLEDFWRRRDPSPEDADNPFRQRFFQRVADADLLYEEENVRGSLSARGRVYILLGPPTRLAQFYERTPEVDLSRSRGRGGPKSRYLLVETWSYRPEDLAPELRQTLTATGWPVELELRFTAEGGRYTLRQGASLLDLAARSLVQNPLER